MSKKWQPPRDMTPEQTAKVSAGNMCGAKLKHDRGYCSNRPAKVHNKNIPYRCNMHGARSGPPEGNQNARTHGIFSKLYSQEEFKEYRDRTMVDRLKDVIAMLSIRSERALLADINQTTALESADEKDYKSILRIDSISSKVRQVAGGAISGEKQTTRKIVDYKKVVNDNLTLLHRFMDLYIKATGGDDITDDERAEVLRKTAATLMGADIGEY